MHRVTELDSIRGLAAVAVMIYHLDPPAFLFGGVRVDLFLILSGYLVTSIILTKGGADNFYLVFQARRILRLWPLYYLTLAALVAVNTCLERPTPIDAFPNYLTFTQNIQRYWSDTIPPFKWYFIHTWSLALEQQFYLIWPLLLGALGRRRAIPLALSLVAISVVARALGFHWWILMARCDGFALGAILAVLFFDPEPVKSQLGRYRRGFFLGVGFALVFLLATLPFSLWYDFEAEMSFWPSLTVLGFNLVFFSLIGLVLCHRGAPELRVLRDRRLCYLGIISYGIYIYHPMMFLCVTRLSGALGLGDAWWVGPVKLAASVGLASLSWHYLEQPILALRDRFRYSYGPAATFPVTTPAGAVQGADA